MTREIILAAALRERGLILTMLPCARHADIIGRAALLGMADYECGFLTSGGRFVDREEAARVALASGQVTRLVRPPGLYTEDVW